MNFIRPDKSEQRFESIAQNTLLEVLNKNEETMTRKAAEHLPTDELDAMIAAQEATEGKYQEVINEVQALKNDNEATRNTTNKLKTALSAGPGERGRWGEATFEAILELSGLQNEVNYWHAEALTRSSKGNIPDFIIKMAGGSYIAIDAKALVKPLIDSYDDAMKLDDTKARNEAFSKIADSIWSTITDPKRGIAQREYPKMLGEHFGVKGPSFTVVFIPASHILEMAYKHGAKRNTQSRTGVSLQEAAYLNGVLLATPTMVMALLTMVRDEWSAYQSDQEHEEIENLIVELYNRHVRFGSRLASIGAGLTTVSNNYNAAVATYQGNKGIRIIGENLEKLGVGARAGNKPLPDVEEVDVSLKEVDELPLIGDAALAESENEDVEVADSEADDKSSEE